MKSRFLFSRYFGIVGWIMAVPGLVLGSLFVQHHLVFEALQYEWRDSVSVIILVVILFACFDLKNNIMPEKRLMGGILS